MNSARRVAAEASPERSEREVTNGVAPGVGLIGRDNELAIIRHVIDQGRSLGSSLLVRGEPGLGKSSLLRAADAIAAEAGSLVLEAAGIESESMQPFAGLHQLLRPLLPATEAVPDVQRRALMTALGLRRGPPPELFLIALAAMTLVMESAASRPVVLIVDDVQWIDAPSNDVLAFLARRVSDDPVVMISGLRDGHVVPVCFTEPRELVLTGLDRTSARALLDADATDLSAADRKQILAQARGNPLALVELPAVWRTAGAEVISGVTAVAPLSTRLEQAFAARIQELPSATRDALLIAAVNAEESLTEVLAGASCLSGSPATSEVFEPAQEVGLVNVDHGLVRFRHPLVRSGVLHYEQLPRQRAAHAAMSETLRAQSHRRVWHLAQSVDGLDDDVADRLDASHVESLGRGSVGTAVAALERAAQLTTDPRVRGNRLLLAAQHAFALGRMELVNRLVDEAAEKELTELDAARAEWLRELFSEGELGDSTRVLELCELAALAAGSGDTTLALALLASASLRSWWSAADTAARHRVIEVAEGLTGLQNDARCLASIAKTEPLAKSRQTQRRLAQISPSSVSDADQLMGFGFAARAVGSEVLAADYFERAESRLRERGQLGLLPHVLAVRAAVCLDLGDWRRAGQSLEEGRRLATETGQTTWTTGVAAVEAVYTGLAGDPADALLRAADLEREFSGLPANDFLSLAQLARGAAHLSAGWHKEAFLELEPMFDSTGYRHHMRESLSGVGMFVEAAVGCGEQGAARSVVERMEALLKLTQSPVLAVQLLYARPVLAEPEDAEDLFLSGLSQDLTQWPWPRARIELAYGTWLRRRRRPLDAREPLRSALVTFEHIGADGWAAQARTGLRAAGDHATVVSTGKLEQLMTTQEMQIARLAADGLSNREIGDRLFLSPRTIGSHLYRIFPKLGIHARAQLTERLRDV